jgi:hypothetical protein
MTRPTVALPATQPVTPAADPAATPSAARQWLPGLAGVSAAVLIGLAVWLLSRRRHPG